MALEVVGSNPTIHPLKTGPFGDCFFIHGKDRREVNLKEGGEFPPQKVTQKIFDFPLPNQLRYAIISFADVNRQQFWVVAKR